MGMKWFVKWDDLLESYQQRTILRIEAHAMQKAFFFQKTERNLTNSLNVVSS